MAMKCSGRPLIVPLFMWTMIREVGRYTVVTGRTLLEGCGDLPRPKGWAVRLIFIPQLLAAVVTIAGIAALIGSVLMIAFPGEQRGMGWVQCCFRRCW
ncbi:MAG: hypothetical protein A4E19_19980 [Nitrospira sp. SG-bin1]|nr:MAG: hypothetical protein A4E19_19980 [Nitrospira sp. SG-bin1]